MEQLIYVAPNSGLEGDGTFLNPFASIEEAKLKAREMKNTDVRVVLRGGVYPITETIHFGIMDGGGVTRSVTYEAYEGETPILTSAVEIKGWEKVEEAIPDLPEKSVGHIYRAKFPEGVDEILTLFHGKECLTRCHSEMFMPEKLVDYERMDSLNVAKEEDRPLLRRIDFKSGMIKSRSNMSDIELRFMPVPWTMNLLPIKEVDEKNSIAYLAVEATAPMSAKPDGMQVENDIMYLTQEGTFCTNSVTREIFYFGDPEEMNIWTPTVKTYLLIEGEIDYLGKDDIPVRNLHFKGLELLGGLRDRTEDGYKGTGIQHDWEMFDKSNSLIRFRGAKECSIRECYIHSTSATALRLDLYCQDIIIENNLFDNIGNMGILLCGYGPGTKDVNHHNMIRNNIITRCGAEIWHGHAIFLWQSGYNVVEHNKIHHSARKGIGLCGVRITILKRPDHKFDEASKTIRWDEIERTFVDSGDEFVDYLPYLHTRNNQVRNNEIYKVLEKIGDGSALNVSGAGMWNVISNNYLHHISTFAASSVVRCDDWQCGTTFQNNVIYKSNISGITRKNFNNIINNIMVDLNCKNGYIRFASYPDEKANYGALIKHNICYDSGNEMQVFGKGYLVSEGACLPEHCDISENLYYCKLDNSDCIRHLKEVKEKKTRVANPLFYNIEKEDFRFQSNSPAFEMGIMELDVREMGITSEFPRALKEKEYIGSMKDIYSRGTDKENQNYNWW